MNIELLEIFQISADSDDSFDTDKTVLLLRVDGAERRLVMPKEKIGSKHDVELVLKKIATKLKTKPKNKEVTNLSPQLRGTYIID